MQRERAAPAAARATDWPAASGAKRPRQHGGRLCAGATSLTSYAHSHTAKILPAIARHHAFQWRRWAAAAAASALALAAEGTRAQREHPANDRMEER